MTARRALLCIVLVAIVHGVFFIWYQRPDWYTPDAWTDQVGYRQLGQALATTGKFTKFPDAAELVPEVIRTPVYPMFLAVIYKVAGTRQLPVALTQTALFAAMVLFVYAIARRIDDGRDGVALGAAALTALFSPIPYFGALVLTELWTTFVFTASMWMAIRAVQSRRLVEFGALGILLGITALSRPIFALFPVGIVLVGLVFFPLTGVTRVRRPAMTSWAVLLATFAIAMLPWFTYNYVTLGQLTLSPAGGMGRGMWEGSWQATWSGRLQNELTLVAEAAEAAGDRGQLDARVEAIAAREHLSSAPMLEYVHQWWDIRRIWTAPAEPQARAAARVEADKEYMRVGRSNISQQSTAHIAKRLARGVFILWAGEIPIRYSDINALPTIVTRVIWGIQALLFLAAAGGVYALIRAGHAVEGCTLGAAIVYVTAVHFFILTEARQSLPAQPTLLVLAAFGIAHLLALKSQVHEREHL